MADRTATLLGKPIEQLKIVTCHLGNGSSITAVDRGKSIDTSMGLTPLEGVIMGTRCGNIDPAIIFDCIDHLGMKSDEINNMLNKQSGILGHQRQIQRYARSGGWGQSRQR